MLLELLQPRHDVGGVRAGSLWAAERRPQPGELQGLLRGRALRRLEGEQLAHGVLRGLRHRRPLRAVEAEQALAHLLENLHIRIAGEWRVPAEQDVGYHAGAPDVALLAVAPGVPAPQHLWRDVVRSAHPRGHQRAGLEAGREAEVDQLQGGIGRVALEENIFWLHVPVRDLVRVQVTNPCEHLLNVLGRSCLAEATSSSVCDAVEQLPARAQLHDEVHSVLLLEGLEQPHHVGVVHLLADLDLAFQPHGVRLRSEPDALDGAAQARLLAAGDARAPEAAFAQAAWLQVVDAVQPPRVVAAELELEVEVGRLGPHSVQAIRYLCLQEGRQGVAVGGGGRGVLLDAVYVLLEAGGGGGRS
mmetsp:Transcript_20161/g.53863  ORF Transcript_20161/g.53863 Transcript_20161/m.53863 type:complete len:359 (+) Transcript_20161:566-1642(+)